MNQTIEIIVNVVGWTLLHFLWQGAIIYILFTLSRTVLSTANPAVRHGNALVWLMLAMLLPVLTAALLFSSPVSKLSIASSAVPAVAPILSWAGQSVTAPGVLPLLGSLWLSGAILLSVRLLRDWRSLARFTCAGARPLPQFDHAFAALLDEMDLRLNLRLKLRLVEAANASVPMVVGVLKPMIVIPSSALLGLTSRELELIIAHELAHLKRKDHLINYLLLVAETLLFFHPVIYSLTRTIRHERELCCDDLVMSTFNERVCYAHALSKLETLRSVERVPTADLRLAAIDGPLVIRISRLVQQRTHRQWGVMSTTMLPLVAAVFMGVVLYETRVAPVNVERALGKVPSVDKETAAVLAGSVQTEDDFVLERIDLANYSRRYIDAATVSRITAVLTQGRVSLAVSTIGQSAEFLARNSQSAEESLFGYPSASVSSEQSAVEGQSSGLHGRDLEQRQSNDMASAGRPQGSVTGRITGPSLSRPDQRQRAPAKAAFSADSAGKYGAPGVESFEGPAESSRIAYDMTEISTMYAPVTRQAGLPALPVFQPHLSSALALSGQQPARKTSRLELVETLSGGGLIHSVTPRYPNRARSRGLVDKVVVSIRIDPTGKVDDVSIVNQNSRPMFQRAVVRAVSQWKFEPLLRNGEPVEQTLEQSFSFQLQPYTAGRRSPACFHASGVECRTT